MKSLIEADLATRGIPKVQFPPKQFDGFLGIPSIDISPLCAEGERIETDELLSIIQVALQLVIDPLIIQDNIQLLGFIRIFLTEYMQLVETNSNDSSVLDVSLQFKDETYAINIDKLNMVQLKLQFFPTYVKAVAARFSHEKIEKKPDGKVRIYVFRRNEKFEIISCPY